MQEPTLKRRRPVQRFIGYVSVAKRIGLRNPNSLSRLRLPPHDAEIDGRRGWSPQTIDEWNAGRRGPGRPPKNLN